MRSLAPRLQLFSGVVLLFFLIVACSRTQTPAAQKPAPPPFEYIGEWGMQGEDPGQLNDPSDLAVDSINRVFIANSGNGSIDKFSVDGHPLLSFMDAVPHDLNKIAVDRGGGIYAASPRLNTIYIYSPAGELFRTLPLRAPRIERIQNIAVAEDGAIVVIESSGTSNQREMQKYTSTGRLLRSWRLRVDSNDAAPVPASIGFGSDLSIYVVDATGQLLQKFTPDGEFQSEWVWKGSDPAPAPAATVSGAGIGVTLSGIVVADPGNHGVRVWGLDGQQKFSDTLGGKLQDSSAFEIATAPNGELLVLDASHTRVYEFRMHF